MQEDLTKKEKDELTFSDKLAINCYDLASVLVSAIVTIMLIFTFVFRIVGVVGTSMVPTLNDGDWLGITAWDRNPSYGQVIIITQPNWFDEPIVKRIIATENQTVDINFNRGEVYVDGVLLDEPYINNLTLNQEDGVTFPLTVPEGHVFVMGDNRQGSTDSRSEKIGFIDEDYILGVVKVRPFNVSRENGKFSMYPVQQWKIAQAKLTPASAQTQLY